jgi:hypothetical protein
MGEPHRCGPFRPKCWVLLGRQVGRPQSQFPELIDSDLRGEPLRYRTTSGCADSLGFRRETRSR